MMKSKFITITFLTSPKWMPLMLAFVFVSFLTAQSSAPWADVNTVQNPLSPLSEILEILEEDESKEQGIELFQVVSQQWIVERVSHRLGRVSFFFPLNEAFSLQYTPPPEFV